MYKKGKNFLLDIVKKTVRSMMRKADRFFTVGGLDVASETKEQLDFLRQLVEENRFEAVIDKIYPLDRIVEAHRYVDLGLLHKNINPVRRKITGPLS